MNDEDKLAKDISEKIKKDIDEMCFNYRLLGDIHNKDVEIREELQERIDKAIEYIDNTDNDMSYDNNGHHYYKNGRDLLDILRGEDKE